MVAASIEPLDLAVSQGLALDLVAHVAGMAQRYRVKLLAHKREDGGGVWVHALGGEGRIMERLASCRGPIQATFTLSGTRYRFTTEVVRRERRWCSDTMIVDAVLLSEPADVGRVEHREHKRVLVSDCGVQARLYLPSATLPKPLGRDGSEIPVKVWNLSVGGAALMFPLDRRFLLLAGGDVLVIGLACWSRQARHLCALRHVQRLSNNIARMGVEFVAGEPASPEVERFRNLVDEMMDRSTPGRAT
jgi:hypothetical protein